MIALARAAVRRHFTLPPFNKAIVGNKDDGSEGKDEHDKASKLDRLPGNVEALKLAEG